MALRRSPQDGFVNYDLLIAFENVFGCFWDDTNNKVYFSKTLASVKNVGKVMYTFLCDIAAVN
jgi:hypothetical protein